MLRSEASVPQPRNQNIISLLATSSNSGGGDSLMRREDHCSDAVLLHVRYLPELLCRGAEIIVQALELTI